MKEKFLIPIAILIAGLMVSIALIYNVGSKNINQPPQQPNTSADEKPSQNKSPLDNLRPVSADDHIRGNPQAPIKIIEFSDLECPYCKFFHSTMQKIVADYEKEGKVAWVYRHFPIDQLHSKARKEAEASECAAELGGPLDSEASNEKFWAYIDKVFASTPSNNNLDLKLLPKFAQDIGLNRQQFEDCLSSGKYNDRVAQDVSEAMDIGITGTPSSVVINQKGEKTVIPGALPYEQVKEMIEQALGQ